MQLMQKNMVNNHKTSVCGRFFHCREFFLLFPRDQALGERKDLIENNVSIFYKQIHLKFIENA
jgi:hypothetical protein